MHTTGFSLRYLGASRTAQNVSNRHCGGRARTAAMAAVETLEDRKFFSSVALVPTADAYVRDGSYANTNFGTAPDLQVKTAPAGEGYVRNSYLTFNLAGQATITSAILELYGEQSSTAVEPSISIAAHAVTSNAWTQTGIKFDNAPAISSATLASANISGTTPVLYYLNLTSYFQQQQAASHTTVSLALTGVSSTGAYADFSSTNAASNDPLLLLQTGSPTPTPTPSPTVTNFGASEDAYVEGGSGANTNFGSSTTLQVKQSTPQYPAYTRISYLTFDLSSVSSSATINSATLSLYGNVNGSSPVQVDVYQVPGGTFNQGTITYNNAPVLGTEITSAVISGTSSSTYTFNLKTYVQEDVAAGQSQVTIALVGDAVTNLFAAFNSSNAGSHQPSLLVSYQ